MNNKGNVGVYAIVITMMVIIVGVVFIQEIANQQSISTTKSTVPDEAISIAPARLAGHAINTTYPFTIANAYADGDWQQTDCPFTDVTYGNASTNFVSGTDYVFGTPNGTFYLRNTADVNNSLTNSTFIDYTFCQDGYNKDGSSRNIAALWTLFAALILLGGVLSSSNAREWFKETFSR